MLLLTILLSIYFNFSSATGGKFLERFKSRSCQTSKKCLLDSKKGDSFESHEEGSALLLPSSLVDVDVPKLARDHFSLVLCEEYITGNTVCDAISEMIIHVPFHSSKDDNSELDNLVDSLHRALSHKLRFDTYLMEESALIRYLNEYNKEFQKYFTKNIAKYFGKKELIPNIIDDSIITNYIQLLVKTKSLFKIIIELVSNLYPDSKLFMAIPKKVIVESIRRELIFIFGNYYALRIMNQIDSILFNPHGEKYTGLYDFQSTIFYVRNNFNVLHGILYEPIERVLIVLIYIYNKPGFMNMRTLLGELISEIQTRHELDLNGLKYNIKQSSDKYRLIHGEFLDALELYKTTNTGEAASE